MKIFITGATGFIGNRLTRELARDHDVYILVRRESLDKARSSFGDSVQYIIGDITQNDIIDQVSSANILNTEIDSVIHLAAHYNLAATMGDAYIHNVVGTQNLLFLLEKMENLKAFHYVSTYAVCGTGAGIASEDFLESSSKLSDNYSRTKMQAEVLVRNARLPGVKKRIYRPGIIVGDSETGEMDKVDGPYYFFEFFKKLSQFSRLIPLKILPLSFRAEAIIPLLPVDVLVQWMSLMIKNPTEHELRSYHLLPTEKILIGQFIEESLKAFNLKIRIQRVPYPELYERILPYLRVPKEVVTYMNSNKSYGIENLKADFPEFISPKFRTYLPTLIARFMRGSK